MGTRRFQFTVDHMVGRRELELTVTYSMTAPVAATYWQPAEGGEIEIESVKCGDRLIPLTEELLDALYQMAADRAHQDWAEEDAAEQDWRYQEYRDRLLMERWERGA
jgi:hypothetical protein